MSSNFISAPTKKGFEIKLTSILSSYVRDTYGNEQCDSHMNAFSDFNSMRSNMLSKLFDKHESSLNILTKYHDQFVALEYKVPLEENGVRVDFKWEDAFSKESLFGKKTTLKIASGAYERICILYNVAAVMSQVAENQNLNDESGLKNAVKYYQQAAGIFSYIKSAVPNIVTREPTLDLNNDTLSTLTSIMLAQAQELIYTKSVKDQKNNGLVGKLAQHLSDLYADTLKLMQLSSVKSIWPKDWIPLIAGKEAGYHAIAEYYTGKDCASNQDFGEAICRLKQGIEFMKTSASRSGSKFLFKTEQDRIKRELETLEKENNMIYHCNIPSHSSLPGISKLAVAKEIPPSNPINSDFKDLFSKIVPLALHSAMMGFENKKKAMINAEIYRLKEATDTLTGVMTSLNLPAAIEDSKGDQIPESLLTKAAKVRSEGGIKKVEDMINNLPDIAQRNLEILKESFRMLNDEEESDTKLREQFKEKWTRTNSRKLTENWRADLFKHEKLIEQAKVSDETVRTAYREHADNIRLLSESESVLKEKLPKSTGGNDGISDSTKSELRKLCQEVEQLKSVRIDLVQEVQQMETSALTNEFTKALSEDSNLNQDSFADEKINEMLQPFRERVRESLAEQEKMLNEIQQKASQLGQSAGGNLKNRATVISGLLLTADKYHELIGNLEEGQNFYNNLTEIFLKFQNKVKDFCFARKTEKDELMKDLQSVIVHERSDNLPTYNATSAGTGNIRDSGSAPARPPQTYQTTPGSEDTTKKKEAPPPPPVAPMAAASTGAPSVGPGAPHPMQPQGVPYPPSPYNMPGYMPGMPQPGYPNAPTNYPPYQGYYPNYSQPMYAPQYQPGAPQAPPPPHQQQQPYNPGYPYYPPRP